MAVRRPTKSDKLRLFPHPGVVVHRKRVSRVKTLQLINGKTSPASFLKDAVILLAKPAGSPRPVPTNVISSPPRALRPLEGTPTARKMRGDTFAAAAVTLMRTTIVSLVGDDAGISEWLAEKSPLSRAIKTTLKIHERPGETERPHKLAASPRSSASSATTMSTARDAFTVEIIPVAKSRTGSDRGTATVVKSLLQSRVPKVGGSPLHAARVVANMRKETSWESSTSTTDKGAAVGSTAVPGGECSAIVINGDRAVHVTLRLTRPRRIGTTKGAVDLAPCSLP